MRPILKVSGVTAVRNPETLPAGTPKLPGVSIVGQPLTVGPIHFRPFGPLISSFDAKTEAWTQMWLEQGLVFYLAHFDPDTDSDTDPDFLEGIRKIMGVRLTTRTWLLYYWHSLR
jgi:hypothetical protein